MSQHTMSIKLEGLIELLAKNLYADPDVFVREIIQNAHDATVKRELLASERQDRGRPKPEIRVDIDGTQRTIAFSDNGAGLSLDEIHRFLSTIGNSDKDALRSRIATENFDHSSALQLIGQFGIGLLSSFIVADRVEIVSRAAGGQPAFRWVSVGNASYTVEEAERPEVGSTVSLRLRSANDRYLNEDYLKSLVLKYADIIGVPIYFGSEVTSSNAVDAPWDRKYTASTARVDAHRDYWEKRFPEETSLEVVPLDETFVWFDGEGKEHSAFARGVLGITDRRIPLVNTRGTVDLFIARMFIASGMRRLLPEWASFVQGVVECSALRVNAARDNIIPDPALEALRKRLGSRIIEWLIQLSKDKPARFREIIVYHSYQVLAMSLQERHEDFFRAVADIIPLASDRGFVSIEEYLRTAVRLPTGRSIVYYITEGASAAQFFMLCAERGICVINADAMSFAEGFLHRYAETWPERVELRRVDLDSSEILEPVAAREEEPYRIIGAQIQSIAGCVAKVSRFRPRNVPMLLTHSKDLERQAAITSMANDPTIPASLRNVFQSLKNDKPEPLTIHINADNPIIERLARRERNLDELGRHALLSLYNNAVMLHARNVTPDNIQIMMVQHNQVIDLLLSNTTELEQAKRRILELEAASVPGAPNLSRCVACFVALPYDDPQVEALYGVLESILEDAPLFWNLVRADDGVEDARLWQNVYRKMAGAHCFIAEVSEHNPNVMIEIGRMEAFNRPVLLLKRKGSPDLPADLRERLYIEYDSSSGDLAERLREGITQNKDFSRQAGERYLSATVLQRIGLQQALCRQICAEFETCADFLKADASVIAKKLGVSSLFIQGAQESLRELLHRHDPVREALGVARR